MQEATYLIEAERVVIRARLDDRDEEAIDLLATTESLLTNLFEVRAKALDVSHAFAAEADLVLEGFQTCGHRVEVAVCPACETQRLFRSQSSLDVRASEESKTRHNDFERA